MTLPTNIKDRLAYEYAYQFGKRLRETVDFLEQAENIEELYTRTALIPVDNFTTVTIGQQQYMYKEGKWHLIKPKSNEDTNKVSPGNKANMTVKATFAFYNSLKYLDD